MISTIKIKGMSCNHCVAAVTKALNEIDGVTRVQVSLDLGQATIESKGSIDMDQVKQNVEKAGFELG